MGRKSSSSKYIRFDSVSYVTALRSAVREASEEVRQLMYSEVYKNASSLPFKDNIVPLANGSKTTDAKRAPDLLGSIESSVGNYLNTTGVNYRKPQTVGSFKVGHRADKTAIPVTVTAMTKYYKQSHIGWYYEYGTGEKEEVPFAGYWQTEARNPLRTTVRSPIVSRPAGIWKDAGGNIRRSRGKGGRRTPDFVKSIGEDVEAHRWFGRAIRENKKKIYDIYSKHVLKVDWRNYMHVQTKIVLGRKG